MVVDDDADTCEALSVVLRESGAIVRIARSVDEALAIDAAARMDAVISDISMPGSDGSTLVCKIREHDAERGSHTIVIAMTGMAGQNNRDKTLAAGFDEHIAKPVEPRALIATLQRLMRARR
jgi:CheY-like chemotaxis protein